MALVLTLQLLMLLLATTSFSAAPPGCPYGPSPNLKPENTTDLKDFQLAAVYVGVGKNNYTCTDPGGYELVIAVCVFLFTITKMMDRAVEVDITLFDATCLNGTDYLKEVVDLTVVDVRENNGSLSEVFIYLQDDLTLDINGRLISINASFLEINVGSSEIGNSDIQILTFVQDSDGKRLANEDETIAVLVDAQVVDFNAPPPPPNATVSISWVCDIDAQLTLALQCVVGTPAIEVIVVTELCKCISDAELAFDSYLTQRIFVFNATS
jgi:hypothetical protein